MNEHLKCIEEMIKEGLLLRRGSWMISDGEIEALKWIVGEVEALREQLSQEIMMSTILKAENAKLMGHAESLRKDLEPEGVYGKKAKEIDSLLDKYKAEIDRLKGEVEKAKTCEWCGSKDLICGKGWKDERDKLKADLARYEGITAEEIKNTCDYVLASFPIDEDLTPLSYRGIDYKNLLTKLAQAIFNRFNHRRK